MNLLGGNSSQPAESMLIYPKGMAWPLSKTIQNRDIPNPCNTIPGNELHSQSKGLGTQYYIRYSDTIVGRAVNDKVNQIPDYPKTLTLRKVLDIFYLELNNFLT